MGIKFTNNANTTLATATLNPGDTALTVQTSAGALFPTLAAGDYFYFTLADGVGNIEICKCTARTGDSFGTIVRAQDGTSARTWSAGATVSLRFPNAAILGQTAESTPFNICEGRLTLTSGTPITVSDVTAATTIYFTPFRGSRISLYDGTSLWTTLTFSEISIAVPATTSQMYDIFVYNNGGVPALELLAWTNDTTRATALTAQNGVYVKTGATTRRYLGSFRTTTVSGQTEDSVSKRYLWNYYNRVTKPMYKNDPAGFWTFAPSTAGAFNWRQANANTANQLDVVVGLEEDAYEVTAISGVAPPLTGYHSASGVGLDSSTTNLAQVYSGFGIAPASNAWTGVTSKYNANITPGRHFFTWLEGGYGTVSYSFIGTSPLNGATTGITLKAPC